MNSKQTASLLVTFAPLAAAAPPLIIGGAIGLGIVFVLKSLFEDKQAKPEAATGETNPEITRKPAETVVFHQIPAKPAVLPRPVLVPVPPPAVSKITAAVPVPAAVIVPKIVSQSPPPAPVKKKSITREDMATVFQRGARTLTRTAAVTAFKALGFGKTAAYAALSPDGRFSAWLQHAPDGIITWTDGQKV